MLSPEHARRLVSLAKAMVDQEQARILIPPYAPQSGYWFGGGNLAQCPDGRWYLCGRYRNAGDSRTGVAAGERGLELALFEFSPRDLTVRKAVSWSKESLHQPGREVLSFEGCALRPTAGGVTLYFSAERTGIDYPPHLAAYHKPGTGVWTVDELEATSVEDLGRARPRTVLEGSDPRYLHLKDPFLDDGRPGSQRLFFCTHPYCWSSSNSAFVEFGDKGSGSTAGSPGSRNGDVASRADWDFFPRGTTWDVAITRATCSWRVPQEGLFQGRDVTLLFYDGGECLRPHTEHRESAARPRGYSCEEIGGLAYYLDGDPRTVTRLSLEAPLFVSPFGTGCSRYVDVVDAEGDVLATWQQAQADGSQPLVIHRLERDRVRDLLA